MDVESRRDLQLLEALEQEATITQRGLSGRLGIALGLTNLYLKRLIRKGYVKCVTVAPNRLVYSLTPRGVARKARLTYEFMKYSLDFYRDARQHLRRSLIQAVGASWLMTSLAPNWARSTPGMRPQSALPRSPATIMTGTIIQGEAVGTR